MTESNIVQIAKRLTDKLDVVELGLNLKIERHTINTIFSNYPHSITPVADEILCVWFGRQGNKEDMYNTLGKALIETKLNQIAREILVRGL